MANDKKWSVDSIIAELQEHEKDAGVQFAEKVLNDDPEKVAAAADEDPEKEPLEGAEKPEEDPEEVVSDEKEPEKTAEELAVEEELKKEAEMWADRGRIFADSMWSRLNENAANAVEKVAEEVADEEVDDVTAPSEKVAAALKGLTKTYLEE